MNDELLPESRSGPGAARRAVNELARVEPTAAAEEIPSLVPIRDQPQFSGIGRG